jgi:hemolysin III
VTSERRLTTGEEIANAITHGVGLIAALIAAPVLLVAAAGRAAPRQVWGCAIFAASLVLLYGVSTIYHALPHSRVKRAMQLVDHMAIYILIAGTYTPFTLGVLQGAWSSALSAVIWTLALTGILFKSLFRLRYPRLSTALYLAMGWLALAAMKPLADVLPGPAMALLMVGGLLYTGGVLFYVRERPRFTHTVWHLFVLGGSVCHFLAVLWYAIPTAG